MSFSFKPVVAESDGVYSPIAPGIYDVQFDTLEEKPTVTGGIQWSAKMKIVGSGRTFFLQWNVENASEVAKRIAREQLTQIATLIGVQNDISIESIRTNKIFTITLEQRVVGEKTYYQTKGPWKLAQAVNKSFNIPSAKAAPTLDEAVKMAEKAFSVSAPAKKAQPWAR
jgi:hypothetical protein